MEDFEKLLSELLNDGKKKEAPSYKEGEQHEVVVRYAIGREDQAKAYLGKDPKTDCYALLHAAGKLLGEEIGQDGAEIGNFLVKAVIKYMAKCAIEKLFEGI